RPAGERPARRRAGRRRGARPNRRRQRGVCAARRHLPRDLEDHRRLAERRAAGDDRARYDHRTERAAMKLTTGFVLGLLLGAAGGVAALYYNPLTEPDPPPPGDTDWALTYRFPKGDAIAFTHGAHGRLAAHPPGI